MIKCTQVTQVLLINKLFFHCFIYLIYFWILIKYLLSMLKNKYGIY